VLRLKRQLEAALTAHGVEISIPPDGPTVRMIDQEVVREQFYLHTPADGSPDKKGNLRRQQFFRALDWAERNGLVGITEIDGVVYLWLTWPETDKAEEE
jgi:hypothetical protein